MKTYALWVAAILAGVLCVSIYISIEGKDMVQIQRTTSEVGQSSGEGPLSSLIRAKGWLNSQPLSATDLRGKVVLVDFWTYTCINWRRTLPYLRAWSKKYADQELAVIGVHTPEFSFERDVGNITTVAKAQKVDYPIAIDSDYAIWNAFSNRYWPAVYLIDAQGRIRHQQFGEADYEQLELVIQKLLAEAGHTGFDPRVVSGEGEGAERAADWTNLATPETYAGSERAENFVSSGGGGTGGAHVYAAPATMKRNDWALSGDWTMRGESAVLNKSNGKVIFRFHARDLHLVMGAAARGTSIRYRVLIDGKPPGASHGVDVDAARTGVIGEPRMYQLVRQSPPIEDRQFEIEFLDPGAEIFVFTFG